MKKMIGSILLVTLLVTTVSGAFAKQDNEKRGNGWNKAADQVKIETAQSTSTQQVTAEQQNDQQTGKQQKEEEKQQKELEKQQKEVDKQKKDELKQQKEEVKQQTEVKKQKTTLQDDKKQDVKTKKQTFKINGSPVIQYGKFKLPIRPITKGLDATLQFDKESGVLKVVKDNTTIVIDFKNKTVTINGVNDSDTMIFTVKDSKKMNVLIKYIANELGIRVKVDGNKVVTETPQDNPPVVATGSAISLN